MTEPWMFAWNTVKDRLAEAVHDAWAKTKLSHGFADHPWSCLGSSPDTCAMVDGCAKHHDRHHTDMIPFADMSDEIKAYDYETALTTFPIAFEAGREYEREHRS